MVTLRDPREILIVEDDFETAEVVCAVLENAGYSATAVDSGAMALSKIADSEPDLMLLDLRLPDIHGVDLLRQVRATSFLPIIIMSGSPDGYKVKALDAGADDYLPKPFSHAELVARVGALLRRVDWTPTAEPKLIVRQLELDVQARKATIRGKRLHLTPIEYGILAELMRTPDQVISHDALLRAVWGEQYEGDYSVLRVNISRLRQKLEENPRHPGYIVTVAGQGYIMSSKRV